MARTRAASWQSPHPELRPNRELARPRRTTPTNPTQRVGSSAPVTSAASPLGAVGVPAAGQKSLCRARRPRSQPARTALQWAVTPVHIHWRSKHRVSSAACHMHTQRVYPRPPGPGFPCRKSRVVSRMNRQWCRIRQQDQRPDNAAALPPRPCCLTPTLKPSTLNPQPQPSTSILNLHSSTSTLDSQMNPHGGSRPPPSPAAAAGITGQPAMWMLPVSSTPRPDTLGSKHTAVVHGFSFSFSFGFGLGWYGRGRPSQPDSRDTSIMGPSGRTHQDGVVPSNHAPRPPRPSAAVRAWPAGPSCAVPCRA